jgi:poly(A) polymerase
MLRPTEGARLWLTDDWKADALRRDFTINALYCDAAGKIHDYVGVTRISSRKRIIFRGAPAPASRKITLRILRFFASLPLTRNDA